MRVKRIDEGALHSRGKVFKQGEWVKVDQATFTYLKRTYPNSFEFDEEVKRKVVKSEVTKDEKIIEETENKEIEEKVEEQIKEKSKRKGYRKAK